MNQEFLNKYAQVIVRIGANVQPGQKVDLTIATDQAELATEIVRESYKAGAKLVKVNWLHSGIELLNYQYAETEVLGETLPWQEEKLRQMVKDLPVRIFVESEDPDALAEADPKKISLVNQMKRKVMKPYRDEIDGKHQWVIVAAPSPAWAKKVFPGLDEEEAVAKLWEAIIQTVRLEGDPVANWKEHNELVHQKADWLNSQKFTQLEYRSQNGTNFRVGLNPRTQWCGAEDKNRLLGVYYTPNMPTEEIFTSPMAGEAEGVLVSTKPLSWQGQLIENFSITFEKGRAVDCKAEKGEEALRQMIAMDEGAALLGEVALVPKESPVNQTGLLFYNTLFDENACCHVALGQGFPETLIDFDGTMADAVALGVNDSMIHVDFMIGADDLEITGIRADGSREAVFQNGTWA